LNFFGDGIKFIRPLDPFPWTRRSSRNSKFDFPLSVIYPREEITVKFSVIHVEELPLNGSITEKDYLKTEVLTIEIGIVRSGSGPDDLNTIRVSLDEHRCDQIVIGSENRIKIPTGMITMEVSQRVRALQTGLPFLEQLDQPIGVDVYLHDVTAKEGEDEG
jgi:hypothetical protein